MDGKTAQHLATKAERDGWETEVRADRNGEHTLKMWPEGGTRREASTFSTPYAYYYFQAKFKAALRSMKASWLALRRKGGVATW